MWRSLLIGFPLWLVEPHTDCLAANFKKPVGYENSPGTNQYQGVSGLDIIVVPNVVGRLADPSGMQHFLKGSGFHIKIVRYETSKAMPEGMIMSQDPGALKEIKAKGPINVVVSTGPDQECAARLNSDEALRNELQKQGNVQTICSLLKKSRE